MVNRRGKSGKTINAYQMTTVKYNNDKQNQMLIKGV